MLAEVVKPFAYYADGVTRVDLIIGDKRDFGTMTAGLVAAGFVAVAAPAVAVEPVVEPVIGPAAEAEAEETPRRGRPRK